MRAARHNRGLSRVPFHAVDSLDEWREIRFEVGTADRRREKNARRLALAIEMCDREEFLPRQRVGPRQCRAASDYQAKLA